ncbi:hypothetical protein [Roseateles noduli]|uniref:hypothetical protein n=1 Tax=Roseateles noduli TaxID=2052484 RepID=UPI003D65A60C
MDQDLLESGRNRSDAFRIILEAVERREGMRRVSAGNALMLGERVPQFPGEDKWFSVLYAPLPSSTIDECWGDLGASVWRPQGLPSSAFADFADAGLWSFPSAYRELLQALNGARFFSGHLNFFGIRTNDPWKTSQPLELISANTPARTVLGKRALVFGGYRSDGVLVACLESDKRVIALEHSGNVIAEWRDLATYVTAEFGRLDSLFDDGGNLRDGCTSGLMQA